MLVDMCELSAYVVLNLYGSALNMNKIGIVLGLNLILDIYLNVCG